MSLSSFNWERGLRRLSYVFLTITWLVAITVMFEDSHSSLLKMIGGLILFTAGYMAFFNFMAWAMKGFSK